MNDIYKAHKAQLLKEIKERQEKIAALDVLIIPNEYTIAPNLPVIPLGYPLKSTLIKKVLFVLELNVNSTAKEIANRIARIESITTESQKKTLSNNVNIYCSRLLKEHKIGAKKVGKTHVYSIYPNSI